jgi:hypothetical protein
VEVDTVEDGGERQEGRARPGVEQKKKRRRQERRAIGARWRCCRSNRGERVEGSGGGIPRRATSAIGRMTGRSGPGKEAVSEPAAGTLLAASEDGRHWPDGPSPAQGRAGEIDDPVSAPLSL